MIQNYTAIQDECIEAEENNLRFFTETIEVEEISPLAFFEAGADSYTEQRFYWENADQTLALVGVGHATVLSNQAEKDRYTNISVRWKRLCASLVKNEHDAAPILFGGFSFDPQSNKESEWSRFPNAYFVVPTFQYIRKNGQVFVSINLISNSGVMDSEIARLREERDQLIYKSKNESTTGLLKPQVMSIQERGKEHYLSAVSNVTQQIREGEAEKVVLARSIVMNFEEQVTSARALYHITNEQPKSYHFALHNDNQLFFGATPERLIEISKGQAYSACVAGSIRRGSTGEEDVILGQKLLEDTKNREEHQYVVDMISKVFNQYCTNITIPKEPKLLKIRDIQHLFTPVKGEVAAGSDIFTLVESLHPTPALGGVPTDKSMAIIRQEENMNRGYYAAPIGWTDSEGDGEFAVAIRSALLEENAAYLYAGGGIVADSEVDKEYEETWVKFRPILRALGGKVHE